MDSNYILIADLILDRSFQDIPKCRQNYGHYYCSRILQRGITVSVNSSSCKILFKQPSKENCVLNWNSFSSNISEFPLRVRATRDDLYIHKKITTYCAMLFALVDSISSATAPPSWLSMNANSSNISISDKRVTDDTETYHTLIL